MTFCACSFARLKKTFVEDYIPPSPLDSKVGSRWENAPDQCSILEEDDVAAVLCMSLGKRVGGHISL